MRHPGRLRGAPVGVRLAAVTALLVLGVGAVLLAASYWLLAVRLPDSVAIDTPTGPVDYTIDTGNLTASTDLLEPTCLASGDGCAQAVVVPVSASLAVDSAVEDYQGQLMRSFATQSAVLLVALTVPAVAVGLFAARRALRPVHAMTSSAGRLRADSLGERLPTDGPRDELRELAETFNAMLDRVEAAFDRERRLMANVSHELRTPLANQLVALEVGLEDDAATAEDLRRVATTALDQNRRARHLIEELLVLARAEQDPGGDTADVVDLADVARHAVDAVRALPDADPGLDVRLDLGPAPVHGQAVLLERLVGNLVENAMRHNTSGGFVRITTGTDGGAARVVVENSGPVVPADAVDGLFEPFRRGAGGDRVRSDRGVGLGLSVVRAVARRYGAQVDAVARAGGGLHVTVTLPVVAHTGVRPVSHAGVPVQGVEVHPVGA